MTWHPTTREKLEYEELRAWVSAQAPGSVGARLCRPRGHFLSHVGVFILGETDDGPLFMQPKYREHKNGFAMDEMSPDEYLKARLICQHRRCGYVGSYLFDRLVLEVAKHARRGGNLEYRLQA